ncbi:hypothetical protein GIB67_006603 [Kingdonia uniflora]|uniref:DNA polymerase II subunit 2 n=1 Tax=Kingdonia uniflora TaxID=39325 RepID=A0A7J7LF20_9MAGN|nr:hypothetical protein GIB67_006603 [Kingdonia uniflora]
MPLGNEPTKKGGSRSRLETGTDPAEELPISEGVWVLYERATTIDPLPRQWGHIWEPGGSNFSQTGVPKIVLYVDPYWIEFQVVIELIIGLNLWVLITLIGVTSCGFPPLEDRDDSLAILEGFDFFGGGSLSTEEKFRLSELEKRAVNDMFVVFSDVWLDHEKTMEKLTTVLDAYEELEVVPYLFVLMGNFCSRPCNLSFSSFSAVRIHFTKLGELIGAHPRLKEHSTFLFIPGPDDAGPSTVLPRCALPHYLTEELQKHIPHAIFSSNPCRIKFCTQEIVIFRQDLLYRMRRSCLIPPSTEDANDPFQHLVTTIILQSHLCPLPLTVQPILWNYDHCLRLYPTPHTIILGDRSEQKEYNYKDTTCFNTGSFANDNTFAVYRPCSQEVELSAVPV